MQSDEEVIAVIRRAYELFHLGFGLTAAIGQMLLGDPRYYTQREPSFPVEDEMGKKRRKRLRALAKANELLRERRMINAKEQKLREAIINLNAYTEDGMPKGQPDEDASDPVPALPGREDAGVEKV